jgi:hypothetical protein
MWCVGHAVTGAENDNLVYFMFHNSYASLIIGIRRYNFRVWSLQIEMYIRRHISNKKSARKFSP